MIIGISGKAGAGKDLSANHLCDHYEFVKVSFADPIKRIAREIYDFTDEQLWGPSECRNAPDKRYLRTTHSRHDWHENSADPRQFKCTRCDQLGDQAGPQCLVYLTPRLALQRFGTEGGRDSYENTWVDYALRIASRIETELVEYSAQRGLFVNTNRTRPVQGTVIPDVRFENEIAAIKKAGGRLIRIKRPTGSLSGSAAQHASEIDQEKIPDTAFDAVINNTSTIQLLQSQLDCIIKDLV